MGPQEMLELAEVKNKWKLTPVKNFKSPRLTARMWRTALVVMLTSIIYQYLFKGRNPCFALIGAVYGVGSQFEEGFHNGVNRLIGTIVEKRVCCLFDYNKRNPLNRAARTVEWNVSPKKGKI